MIEKINSFFSQYNFDIRMHGNARWIDQKCTPDVLNIIADCVVQYSEEQNSNIPFSAKDIQFFNYTEENVREVFNKPNTTSKIAENEYDKFFSQPLEMLASAKILKKYRKGRKNYYAISNKEILEYISIRERNALVFICLYIEKVLKESGLWEKFQDFFDIQTKDAYFKLKSSYEIFIIDNTPINGELEVRRIFAKVLNPLSNKFRKLGTSRGRISKNIISYSELMYNRENFRDLYTDKPKELTRQQWREKNKNNINLNYYKYQSNKAKRFLRKFNDNYRNGVSEINDEYSGGVATQIHHIFPESEFPEISAYLENLIALTPNQHLIKAHPNNNTQRICIEYQEMLLKAKAMIINDNVTKDNAAEIIYSFDRFFEVLSEGFNMDLINFEFDYYTAMRVIQNHYQNVH